MKLFILFFFSVSLFFTEFSLVLASRPATKTIDLKIAHSVLLQGKIETKIISASDSIPTKIEIIPEKPTKNGLGMIIWGSFLTFLGVVFGVALLLTFLLGFSIGSAFYFRDIYAIAGVMLGGLITFGVGIYMIARGKERWKAYKEYKKAVKKMRKTQ